MVFWSAIRRQLMLQVVQAEGKYGNGLKTLTLWCQKVPLTVKWTSTLLSCHSPILTYKGWRWIRGLQPFEARFCPSQLKGLAYNQYSPFLPIKGWNWLKTLTLWCQELSPMAEWTSTLLDQYWNFLTYKMLKWIKNLNPLRPGAVPRGWVD